MNNQSPTSARADADHLASYVASVGKLPEKLALIAANKRSSELSLSRAAAALRSMAALNHRHRHPESRNNPLDIENASRAKR